MKSLKIKGIEKRFIIEPGNIYSVKIENAGFYMGLLSALINEDSDVLIYSEKNELIDYCKKCIFISNNLDIDPNNKKVITALYKKIGENIIDDNIKNQINFINERILNVLNEISLNIDVPMNYELELDLKKLLSIYNFSFDNCDCSYLEKVVMYIKANLEIINPTFVVGIDVLSLLNSSEIEELKKELELLHLSFVDIKFVGVYENDNVESVIIDNDLCEF